MGEPFTAGREWWTANDRATPFWEVPVNADGWSDWCHPLPGYRIQCCDCGLIHEMEFAIIKPNQPTPLNDGENTRRIIIFRARRATPKINWWHKVKLMRLVRKVLSERPTQADYHAGAA